MVLFISVGLDRRCGTDFLLLGPWVRSFVGAFKLQQAEQQLLQVKGIPIKRTLYVICICVKYFLFIMDITVKFMQVCSTYEVLMT